MKHLNNIIQNTPEWDAARLAKPSSSVASRLVTSKGEYTKPATMKLYAQELAMSKYAGRSVSLFTGTEATERGHAIEPQAVVWYAMETGIEMQECGIFTDDLKRYVSSPDRIAVHEKGLLEAKAHGDKIFLKKILDYHETGKPPADNYAQVQDQLFVTEYEWCDLVLYHPDYKKLSLIIRILPDLAFHEKLKIQKTAVIIERDKVYNTLLEIEKARLEL